MLVYDNETGRWIDVPDGSAPNSPNPGRGLGGIGGLFRNLRGRFGAGRSLFGGNFDWDAIKTLPRDIRATQLINGGPTIGQVGAAGMGAYQGIKAIKGLTDNAQADTDYNSLIKDIRSSAYANPMASQYLNSEQNKLLRQARTGSLDTANWGGALGGMAKGVPNALLSTLVGGLVGGAPGAVIGGLGSLGNSAIQGYGDRTRAQTDSLSGLYSALQNAETAYRDEANSRLRSRHFNYMY